MYPVNIHIQFSAGLTISIFPPNICLKPMYSILANRVDGGDRQGLRPLGLSSGRANPTHSSFFVAWVFLCMQPPVPALWRLCITQHKACTCRGWSSWQMKPTTRQVRGAHSPNPSLRCCVWGLSTHGILKFECPMLLGVLSSPLHPLFLRPVCFRHSSRDPGGLPVP